MNTAIEQSTDKGVDDIVHTSTEMDDLEALSSSNKNVATMMTEFEKTDEQVNVTDDDDDNDDGHDGDVPHNDEMDGGRNTTRINPPQGPNTTTTTNTETRKSTTTKTNPRFKMEEYQYQQQDHHNPLNLSNDVQLCTLLQSLSHHVQKRTYELSSSISKLESKLQHVDYNINRVIMLDAMQSDYQSMLFHAAADDDNHKYDYHSINNNMNSDDGNQKNVSDDNEINQRDEGEKPPTKSHSNTNNNESGLDKMQKEEDDAIQDGINALSIFHDPTAEANNAIHADNAIGGAGMGTTDYFGIEEEEEEDDEDSFYYYESSPADVFNQRPLPFIIGSVEFLDSVDGGIGGDIVMDEEEKGQYDVYEDDDSDY